MGGPQTRFQVASRLGGFRDTVTLSDPFGTGATLKVRRKGSAVHREWGKKWLNEDPLTRSMMEEQILGDVPVVLTEEEQKTVEMARQAMESAKELKDQPAVARHVPDLLGVIDRLADTRADLASNRTAIRRALSSGEITIADVAAGSIDLKRRMDEASFLLVGWDNFPDADGNPIPYDPTVVRELLANDTPLEGAGLDELLVRVEPWTIKIETKPEHETDNTVAGRAFPETAPAPVPDPPVILIRPNLTFGRAYILWLHWVSERADLFRGQLMEASAKNSVPPSEASTSPGGGTSSEEPASS